MYPNIIIRQRLATIRLVMLLYMLIISIHIYPMQLAAQTISDSAVIEAPLPAVNNWQAALIYLIPILVPILILLAKKLFYTEMVLPDKSIELTPPKWFPKWSLPLLAIVLGMLIDWIFSAAGVQGTSTLAGAVLGGLGVFVRELFKPLTAKK